MTKCLDAQTRYAAIRAAQNYVRQASTSQQPTNSYARLLDVLSTHLDALTKIAKPGICSENLVVSIGLLVLKVAELIEKAESDSKQAAQDLVILTHNIINEATLHNGTLQAAKSIMTMLTDYLRDQHNVEIINPSLGERVNDKKHSVQISEASPAHIAARKGTICRCMSPGFTQRGQVIIPADVSICS